MRSSLTGNETLFAALPIVLVLITLIGAILFFSNNSLDLRSRANLATPTPTATKKVAIPTSIPTPTIEEKPLPQFACSELYQPVCGRNGLTYSNECEAQVAGVIIASQGECK